MKKFLKYLGIFILIIIAGLYIYFLKFLPDAIDLNAFVPQIQKLVKDNTGFDLKIGNIKLVTTPLLKIGIDADDISINLSDNSTVFQAAMLKSKLSLLHLLLFDVHLSDISIYKPVINLEIANGREFKAIKAMETILLENEKKQSVNFNKKQSGLDITSLIRINVPSFKLYDYRGYISDLSGGEYLLLQGDSAKVGYFSGKRAKVKTQAKLYLNHNKQIDLDIDIDSFIPKQAELDEEDDPAVRVELPFINPVLTYKNYDPKGEIKAKIKLNEKNINGNFAIENLTLDINGYKIPKSYIRTQFFGNKIFCDSNVFLADNHNLKVYGKLKNSIKPDFDLNIVSNGVYFNDLILLGKGILNSFGVKNNLNDIKGEGFFSADLQVKTNSKTLKSNGKFEVKDGAIINSRLGLGLKKINANILLDNNMVEIKNTGLSVNEGNVQLEGTIDKNAKADIQIFAKALPLPELFRAFAPDAVKKSFNLLSGTISFDTKINGKMKNPVAVFMTEINDFKLSDKLGTLVIFNKGFKFDVNNSKRLSGKVSNNGLEISMPYSGSYVKNNLTEVLFDEKNLTLNPSQFKINNKSAVTVSGTIEDYLKHPVYDLKADGNLFAEELREFLGASAKPFIDAKGLIPLKAGFFGNYKKQTLIAQLCADNKNYITPINIKSILNNQTIVQLLIDFKGNRLKIKNTGLYSKLVPCDFSDDFALNMAETGEVAGIEGTIAGLDTNSPVINMLKFNLPKQLLVNISGFKDSIFTINGKLSVYGNIDSPRYKGQFNIKDLSIPDAKMDLKLAKISMNGKDGDFSVENLNIGDSDIQISSGIKLEALPLLSLNNLRFNSNNINVDGLTEISNNIVSMIPQDPTPKIQSDIPVLINSGNFNISTAETGNMNIQNLGGNLAFIKNTLYVNNLKGDIFDGQFSGNLDVNVLNYLVNADLSGTNMDTNNALVALANMKDTLSGALSFDTKISLQGLDFEQQVKSLSGVFNFLIENGQAGPFSKIENIFLSENLRESEFFQSAMGSVITSAVSVDTSRFQELKGTINFKKDGIAYIDPITMQGNALCVKIAGDMDILKNSLDAKVRGRLGSMVDSVLGPLANLNPVNIVKATPGLNVVLAKTFSVFCEKISKEEMNSIPDFSKDRSDFNATKFQIVLKGDVANPLSLLKSFKWLVSDEEYQQAENFVSSIPENLPEGVNTLEEMQIYEAQLAEQEAESKTLKGKIKNLFKRKEAAQL